MKIIKSASISFLIINIINTIWLLMDIIMYGEIKLNLVDVIISVIILVVLFTFTLKYTEDFV